MNLEAILLFWGSLHHFKLSKRNGGTVEDDMLFKRQSYKLSTYDQIPVYVYIY